jgi:hypothetical protein
LNRIAQLIHSDIEAALIGKRLFVYQLRHVGHFRLLAAGLAESKPLQPPN